MSNEIDQFLFKALVKLDKANTKDGSRRSVPVNAPVMTQELFAAISGIPLGVLRAQIQRGYIPSKSFGKRRYVNIALLNSILLHQDHKTDMSE
jgi:hypothetical protein